jgi:putative heme iron utilization protein
MLDNSKLKDELLEILTTTPAEVKPKLDDDLQEILTQQEIPEDLIHVEPQNKVEEIIQTILGFGIVAAWIAIIVVIIATITISGPILIFLGIAMLLCWAYDRDH